MSAWVAVPPPAVSTALGEAAEMWGADWQAGGPGGGHLMLPVRAGLRYGVSRGRLELQAEGEGTAVTFRPEEETYFLDTRSTTVLALSALGALLVLLWPFFPGIAMFHQAVPLGIVLALVGWFLVVSRLETRGAEEFLALVQQVAAGGAAGREGGDEAGMPDMSPPL